MITYAVKGKEHFVDYRPAYIVPVTFLGGSLKAKLLAQ